MGTRRALFTSLGLGSAPKETAEVHIVLLGELGVGKSGEWFNSCFRSHPSILADRERILMSGPHLLKSQVGAGKK